MNYLKGGGRERAGTWTVSKFKRGVYKKEKVMYVRGLRSLPYDTMAHRLKISRAKNIVLH